MGGSTNLWTDAQVLARADCRDVEIHEEQWNHGRLPHKDGNDRLSVKTRGMSDFARIKLQHLNYSERNRPCPKGNLSRRYPESKVRI
jgi:hypothetical protein